MFELMLSDRTGHKTQVYINAEGEIEICMHHFDGATTKCEFDPINKRATKEVDMGRKSECNFTKLQSGKYADLIHRDWTEEELDGRKSFGGHYTFIISEDAEEWKHIPITQEVGSYYTFNNRILQLEDGRIIVPICYEPFEFVEEGTEKGGWVGTFYSDDEGETWKRSEWVKGNNCHNHMAEPICVDLNDGKLKMFSRTADGYMFECESLDRGESWGEEKATSLRMPCSPFVIRRDPYSGCIFVLWNNSFPGPTYQYTRSPFCMAISRDETKTWEFVCEIENDPFCIYGYPSILFMEKDILLSYDIVQGSRFFDKTCMYPKLKIYERGELTVRKEYREPLF